MPFDNRMLGAMPQGMIGAGMGAPQAMSQQAFAGGGGPMGTAVAIRNIGKDPGEVVSLTFDNGTTLDLGVQQLVQLGLPEQTMASLVELFMQVFEVARPLAAQGTGPAG